jgi:hypothetical protein
VIKRASNFRGSGRPTSGATSITMQIYHELTQAGEAGLSFEEIVERVKGRVPAGYAWRKYQADRLGKQARDERYRGISATRTRTTVRVADEPSPTDRVKAIRFTVRTCLNGMIDARSRTAIRRPDGRYAVGLRPPRETSGLEGKYDEDGQITRRQVALMEFLRLARPLVARVEAERLRDHPPKHLPAISAVLYASIKKVVDVNTAQQPAAIVAPPVLEPTPELVRNPEPNADVARIVRFVQQHGGRTIRRQVLSGVKAFNARALDRVLQEYEACYPGSVFYEHFESKRGGTFTRQVITAPKANLAS